MIKASLFLGTVLLASAVMAVPVTLINGTTQGNYNNSLGTVLDLTNPYLGTHLFPGANVSTGDPSLNIPAGSAPDLSAASAQLGNWLTNPGALTGSWSGPTAIPSGWAVNTETAIVYTLNSATGYDAVTASFGVDNGVFLWVDGVFQGGYLRPGGASLGEHVFNLGSLSAGTHYLQVLAEDHGGGTGYAIKVTGEVGAVPEPTTVALMGLGLLGVFAAGRRRKA
ncbi:MAG: PEP-CTERM sorting domain-containing protein [Fibrobacterota bacterium]|nr:PEP-CTERM sorting domain-containing protein [Fibrobacterota bacterium]